MIDRLKNKTTVNFTYPVWGWYKVDGEDVNIHKHLNRCIGMTGIDNPIIYELEIPCNEIVLTDFYQWVELMYFDFHPEEKPEDYDINIIFKLRHGESWQAVFPMIDISYVKKVYKLEGDYDKFKPIEISIRGK